MPRRPTYPHIASTLALCLSLGTTGAYAATQIPRNSVGSPQIRDGSVKPVDLASNAVTGTKVAPDSLTGADIKESTLKLPATSRVYSSNAQNASVALTDTLTPYATTTAVAPTAGFFVITADSTFNGASGSPGVTAQVSLDGDFAGGQYWSPGPGGHFQSQSMTITVPVTAGTHKVTLDMAESGTSHSTCYLSQVTVQYEPAGVAGAVPTPD